MTRYCLEIGPEESASAIVHKLECASYDLGSLLGAGRLVSLGDFDSSLQALASIKANHPDALRCLDCCHIDLILQQGHREALGLGLGV